MHLGAFQGHRLFLEWWAFCRSFVVFEILGPRYCITGQLGLPSVYVTKHQQDLTLSLTQIKGLAYFS